MVTYAVAGIIFMPRSSLIRVMPITGTSRLLANSIIGFALVNDASWYDICGEPPG